MATKSSYLIWRKWSRIKKLSKKLRSWIFSPSNHYRQLRTCLYSLHQSQIKYNNGPLDMHIENRAQTLAQQFKIKTLMLIFNLKNPVKQTLLPKQKVNHPNFQTTCNKRETSTSPEPQSLPTTVPTPTWSSMRMVSVVLVIACTGGPNQRRSARIPIANCTPGLFASPAIWSYSAKRGATVTRKPN